MRTAAALFRTLSAFVVLYLLDIHTSTSCIHVLNTASNIGSIWGLRYMLHGIHAHAIHVAITYWWSQLAAPSKPASAVRPDWAKRVVSEESVQRRARWPWRAKFMNHVPRHYIRITLKNTVLLSPFQIAPLITVKLNCRVQVDAQRPIWLWYPPIQTLLWYLTRCCVQLWKRICKRDSVMGPPLRGNSERYSFRWNIE